MTERKAIVVSAFGRGNWLARELASIGLKTSLVDVTDYLGRWAPEDWEGPFGFLQVESLTNSMMSRLQAEGYHDLTPGGFTMWLKDGPLELKGALSAHRWKALGWKEDLKEYLRDSISWDQKTVNQKKNLLKKKPFSEVWMAHLAHQLASPIFMPNAEALDIGQCLPLFSTYSVRRVNRQGLSDSLEWTREGDVQIFSSARLRDIQADAGLISSLEIESSWSGAINADYFVWSLTSEETQRLCPNAVSVLYPSGPLSSEWMWTRFRVQLKSVPHLQVLPNQVLIVDDPYLPWTHANLMILQKNVTPLVYDAWIRIPTEQRFQRSYLEFQGDAIMDLLGRKIPQSEPSKLDMPQDHLYEYSELGPPRFPVFNMVKRSRFKTGAYRNLYFHSPEFWSNLDWSSQFQHQLNLLNDIKANLAKANKRVPEAQV